MFDVFRYRNDFPILSQHIHGKQLVYLDNAATTQVPQQVIDCIAAHYALEHANVHRGIHNLSERSTQKLELAREAVRRFINADASDEIIFTRGTTDSINLVAMGLEETILPGDEIIVSQLEHHSNFIPWQQLCIRRGAILRVIPTPDGQPDLEAYYRLLNEKTRIVAVTQVSNLTGTVMPLKEIISAAHSCGALVLVDGAQSARHGCDVQRLDCDFFCFSGHKMFAPTGIGVLYGKKSCLDRIAPVYFGGGMVDCVTQENTSFALLPYRLEAGTPNFVGAIALGRAVEYLEALGYDNIANWEDELLAYAERQIEGIEGLSVLGHPLKRSGVLSFSVKGVHPYDLASLLDKYGIAVRSGNHCAQPAMRSFDLESVTRISTAFYNTMNEMDMLCGALCRSITMLKKWRKTNDDSGKGAGIY